MGIAKETRKEEKMKCHKKDKSLQVLQYEPEKQQVSLCICVWITPKRTRLLSKTHTILLLRWNSLNLNAGKCPQQIYSQQGSIVPLHNRVQLLSDCPHVLKWVKLRWKPLQGFMRKQTNSLQTQKNTPQFLRILLTHYHLVTQRRRFANRENGFNIVNRVVIILISADTCDHHF